MCTVKKINNIMLFSTSQSEFTVNKVGLLT